MSILGFIGGTGPEGMGLGLRWGVAGHEVLIGSRSAERAAEKAGELSAMASIRVEGLANEDAARRCEIAFICTPYAGHADTLTALRPHLAGKLVCDVTVPMVFEKGKGALLVDVREGSAAEQARDLLPDSTVVSGFHNVSAESLLELDRMLEGDVIICGGPIEARDRIIAMTGEIPGLRGINGGPLRNSKITEGLTVVMISINRTYNARTHIKVTGIPDA